MCLNFSRKFYVRNYVSFGLPSLLHFHLFVCLFACFVFSFWHFVPPSWRREKLLSFHLFVPGGHRCAPYARVLEPDLDLTIGTSTKETQLKNMPTFSSEAFLSLEGKCDYAIGDLSLLRLVPKFPDLFLEEHCLSPPCSLALPSFRKGRRLLYSLPVCLVGVTGKSRKDYCDLFTCSFCSPVFPVFSKEIVPKWIKQKKKKVIDWKKRYR